MRNLRVITSILVVLVFLLSGCDEQPHILKEVKTIAVTGIAFNLRQPLIDPGDGKGGADHTASALPQIKIENGMINIEEHLTEKNKLFFDEFTNKMILTMETATDLEYVDVEDFFKNNIYNNLPSKYMSDDYYIPAPFRFIDILNTEYARKLCKVLEVDAVANISFQFQRVAAGSGQVGIMDLTSIPVLGDVIRTEKMMLVANIQVIDKNGIIIFSRSLNTMSDSEQTKLSIVGDILSINIGNNDFYKEITGKFINEVVQLINNARK